MSDWSFIRDQIKERVRLSEIVGRKVAFDRRKSSPGRGEFWACCPFHAEKSPSFHVLDREGYYKCFGCGAGGDHVNFIMETENRSYPEAMEMLAELAGLELPKASPAEREKAQARASLHEILDLAAKFYEQCLGKAEGSAARAYLTRRGLPAEAVARFRLGYAPGTGHALIDHLTAANIDPEEMRAAGVLSSREEPADLMRNRLIFPITDGRGRVIAFGGRALEADAQIKYLNSPETELFSKGRTLYNFAAARKRIANSQAGRIANSELRIENKQSSNPHSPLAARYSPLILAEGYMDVIALTRAGFERAVAPLGTALTAEQLELAWSVEAAPVIAFDGDAAGRAAAARALDRALPLLKPGRTLSFAFLPEGQDPDDLMREGGPSAVLRALEKAEPLAEVLWALRTAASNLRTPDGRAAAEASLKAAVDTITEPSVRRHYQAFVRERVAAWLRVKRRPTTANGEWRMANTASNSSFANRPTFPPRASQELRSRTRGRPNPAEEALVVALLVHPEIAAEFAEELGRVALSDPRLDHLRGEILGAIAANGALDRTRLEARLAAHGLGGLARSLEARDGLKCLPCANPAATPEAARASLHDILQTLSGSQARTETAAAVEAALGGGLNEQSLAEARGLQKALSARARPD